MEKELGRRDIYETEKQNIAHANYTVDEKTKIGGGIARWKAFDEIYSIHSTV